MVAFKHRYYHAVTQYINIIDVYSQFYILIDINRIWHYNDEFYIDA